MMQLIGMLDSPYVRRVAISLHTMGIPFEHKPLSVFSTFAAFQSINPVVKAPSLVCANGDVLMDSSLILDYAQTWVPLARQLLPSTLPEKQKALRLLGLALAACEKSVQIVYEKNLRPQEKQHQPWLDRIQGQLLAAYTALEAELRTCRLSAGVSQAAITTAVTWQFSQMMLADMVDAQDFPLLHALSDESEVLEAFMAYPPTGPGVKAI